MKVREIKILATIAALLGWAGCGKGLNGSYIKCIAALATSTRTSYTFNSNTSGVALKKESFSSLDCSGATTIQVDTTGSYLESSSSIPSATLLDINFTQGTLTGTSLFQIYRLDSNNLLLGDASGAQTGITSDKRPTVFEVTPYFKQ